MTFKLELPPDVEQAYLAWARARGLPVDEIVREVLISERPPLPNSDLFAQGLGLFGSPEDAALLDEVVAIAYQERRRPARSTGDL